ncbi:hydrogenase Eha associated protein ribokinase-like [Dehalogenimonas sp. WBC-2]|nr:hydrogenase Eha associated protein ribokinase-like [Dehalogenimonas sp. WBC-2]
MTNYDVIGLGILRSDHIYSADTMGLNGEHPVRRSAVTSGGAAANTVFGLSKLGLKCGLIGVVGNDPAGRELVAEMSSIGVDMRHVNLICDTQTDSAMVINDSEGSRVCYICYDAGRLFHIDESMVDVLNAATIIHIGGLIDQEQIKALATVLKQLNTEVAVSVSISDSEAVLGFKIWEPIIARAAVVLASKTAIEKLTGKNFKLAAKMCRQSGAKATAIFLTCGEEIRKIRRKGKAASVTTYIRNSEYECLIESAIRKWPNVIEPTGAQDAFTTGYLFGLIKGKAIEECGFLGDIMAQACLKKPGARDSLPDAGELSSRYYLIHHEEISF